MNWLDLSATTQLLKRVPYFRSLPLGEVVEGERGLIHLIDAEALAGWTEQTAARPTTSPGAASRQPSELQDAATQ
jgi:hypothetical protein